VARHPYPVICTCLVITAVSSVGFLNFRMEHEADLLWINSDSAYNIHEQWLQTHFKNNQRAQILIVKNKNILTKESILEMLEIHKKIQSINANGKTFDDICAQVPIADIFQTKKRKKRQAPDEEYEYYDYSAIWSDYPDQDQETGDSDTSEAVTPSQDRINFAKYGRHNAPPPPRPRTSTRLRSAPAGLRRARSGYDDTSSAPVMLISAIVQNKHYYYD